MRPYLAMLCAGALLVTGCGAAGPATASTADREIPTTVEARPSSTTVLPGTSSTVPPTTSAKHAPAHGGSVVIADDQEPPTLNPLPAPGGGFQP